MNDTVRAFGGRSSSLDWVIWLATSVFVCSLSIIGHSFITGHSLWIDEGMTAWLASHPTFKELVDTQTNISSSEAQMPFYVWYIWGWAKIFGISEIALRMANLPFVLLLLLVIQWGSRLLFQSRWNWVIVSVSPFLWFYVNEARPYVAVIAFSTLAVVSLLIYLMRLQHCRTWTPWLCLLGVFFCSGVNMLGAFVIPTLLTALVLSYKLNGEEWKVFLHDWLWPILVFLPFFVILGGWFAWTLWHGYGGIIESPGMGNLFFAAWEFLGLLGLGPPRNVLRTAQTLTIFPRYVVTLGFGAIAWLVVIATMIIKARRSGINKCIEYLVGMLCIGLVLFFASASWFRFRFWGRHLGQFFPIFFLLIIGLLGKDSKRYPDVSLRLIASCILITIWSFSSARLAFVADYKKDDYRSAVTYAKNAADAGGTIFWAAHPITGSYYGLRFSGSTGKKVFWPTSSVAHLALNWNENQIETAIRDSTRPIVIAISKPDLYDRHNALLKAMVKNQALLIAAPNTFRIYIIP